MTTCRGQPRGVSDTRTGKRHPPSNSMNHWGAHEVVGQLQAVMSMSWLWQQQGKNNSRGRRGTLMIAYSRRA